MARPTPHTIAVVVGVVVVGAALVIALLSSTSEPQAAVPTTPSSLEVPIPPALPPDGGPPTIRLAVRVNANGAPVAGAEVHLSDGSRLVPITATADALGVAVFEDIAPGAYELWARHDAMVSTLVRADDVGATPTRELELALEPAAQLAGRLVADGPIPEGATIQLVPVDVDHAVRIAHADPEGKFSLDGIPRGWWRLETTAPGFVQVADRIVQLSDQHLDLEIPLERMGVVVGTVVDGAGSPVANATIVLREQGAGVGMTVHAPRYAQISSGRWRWIHPLPERRLLPGHEGVRFGGARAGQRPAECGRGHCGVDLGMGQRGVVVHAAADGEIAAAYTEIRGEAGRYIAIEHGDGVKTFYMHLDELRPGLEVGQKVFAGDPIGTVGSTGVVRSLPHLHFAMTIERRGRTQYIDPEPMLRHAVVLPSARPLDHVSHASLPRSMQIAATAGAASDSDAQKFTTDAQGRFRLEAAPGSYVAVAFASELAPGASPAFSVRSGVDTDGVVISLQPGAIVVGRVRGTQGAIAGALVVAAAGFGETAHKVAMTYTNQSGEFALRSLTGEITLEVSATGHGPGERSIVLRDKDRNRTLTIEDIVLTTENAQLRGHVLAPDGGAPGVVAIKVVDGPSRRRITSDGFGRFTIDNVAAGSYTVELAAPDYPPKRVKLHTDRWTEHRLDYGGNLRCELRDRSGVRLAGIRVEARGPGNRVVQRATDVDGVLELRGLAQGEWSLTARGPGFTPATQELTVRAEKTPPQVVRIELARGATVAGVVRDRYGRRVAGARVSLGPSITHSDRDGNFRLIDVPPGTSVVEAERDGSRGSISIQLAPGDERLTLGIELAE